MKFCFSCLDLRLILFLTQLLAELKSALRGDANPGYSSKLEELRKKLDEIHRTMKERNSERRFKRRDSVGTLWERRMRLALYYRILFKAKDCDDYVRIFFIYFLISYICKYMGNVYKFT